MEVVVAGCKEQPHIDQMRLIQLRSSLLCLNEQQQRKVIFVEEKAAGVG